MKIAFYGSSLLSSYWNGAATYYRGLLRAMAALGHEITFYEPDILDRQNRRDIDPPDWCTVVVYEATDAALARVASEAANADVVVKASGVGFKDDVLLEQVFAAACPRALKVFWDVDAPATLKQIAGDAEHPIRKMLSSLDLVLTYGGGEPVVSAYRGLGARECIPIYNALDPETHHPVTGDTSFDADLAFLGNRLPDREDRVETFFLKPAATSKDRRFLLGGAGWDGKPLSDNVRYLGHVPAAKHNSFNSSPMAVLNVSRQSMAEIGYSPATRVFEAAGSGACLISDAWEGIDRFLKPGHEVLVARDGTDVADILQGLSRERARHIGKRALDRVRREHTYAHRAREADSVLRSAMEERT